MHLAAMKSSGVSRFLSRRDKHHEKRSSKATPGKVCLPTSAPSLDTLYHNLPSALRASVGDGLLFMQRNTPCLSSYTSAVAQHILQRLSDQSLPQSRLSNHVSPDLYTIFTNDGTSPASDKDVEKKVRCSLSTLRLPQVDLV
jgi:hypothetical protein